jgi:HSP20 family molecular chaperone IbpA
MFKVFSVTNDTQKRDPHDEHHHEDSTHTPHSSHDEHHIDVEIREERDHEMDIWQIAVDILDCPNSIIVVAPIAGVDPADIDISISRNILTLSWERKELPIYLEAKRMLVEECFYGTFSRSIILPENLAFDKIHATIHHHVIMVHIPKLNLISKTIKIDESK